MMNDGLERVRDDMIETAETVVDDGDGMGSRGRWNERDEDGKLTSSRTTVEAPTA